MNDRPQLFGVSLCHEKKIVCAIQSFLEWGIWMGRTPRRSRKAGANRLRIDAATRKHSRIPVG
jgi:hypothetical protein